nr:hypothetical protein [Tanacetum cinerariifolium]
MAIDMMANGGLKILDNGTVIENFRGKMEATVRRRLDRRRSSSIVRRRLIQARGGDRGWIYKRRNSKGSLCSYYQSKVNEFLNFTFLIERVVEMKTFGSDVVFRIKCTCSKCKIKVFKKKDEVKFDLWHTGFIRGYTTWYAHGERKCRRAETGECSEPIKEDNVIGCTQMILVIHNTTFQSDLHSDTQEEQASNSFAKQYYEMLEADDEPLYEGC